MIKNQAMIKNRDITIKTRDKPKITDKTTKVIISHKRISIHSNFTTISQCKTLDLNMMIRINISNKILHLHTTLH